MTSLAFAKFPKPGIMYVSEIKPNPCFSHVYSQLNDSVYERWVYSYIVNSASIVKEAEKISRIVVFGIPTTTFPAIHDFSTSAGAKQIPWTFTRSMQGENILLLSYLKSKYTEKFFSVVLIDSNSNTDDLRAVVYSLKKAAGNYGLPLETKKYKLTVNFGNSAGQANVTKQPSEKKYFDALGLQPTPNLGLIRAAYRELAKQFHPDSSGNVLTEAKMKEINEAYEYLLKRYGK